MAFQRNHVSDEDRLVIGLRVFHQKSMYGLVTELARKYLVSRWFIYYCYTQFLLLLELQKRYRKLVMPCSGYCETLEERVVSLYLETEASISGIRRALFTLDGQKVSQGKVSQLVTEYGDLLDSHETVTCCLKFVSDEIFTTSPILVTVEPISGYLLSLDLVESRDQVTWGACWLELLDTDTGQIERIIADQAKGLLGGIAVLYNDHDAVKQVFQGDLFHLLRKLVVGITRAERTAYAAIKQEYKAIEQFERAKSDRVLLKRLTEYETAHTEAEQWMRWYDESRYLFRELQEVLRIVDMQTGTLRRKSEVIGEVEAILELFEQEILEDTIQKGVRVLRDHQDALFPYFDEVEAADETLKAKIAECEVRHGFVRRYAFQQQLLTASGRHKRVLHASMIVLEERLVAQVGTTKFQRLAQVVEQTLSPIIRSSSMVENTNSRLRRFFDSSRGQITQSRLNLIRFYLNHKTFERGRRQGHTPAQLFHGEQGVPDHWLTILRAKKAETIAMA